MGIHPVRLNEDLLWMIFMENTELYHNGRLKTARHTLQVCQQWRRTILRSSSLWGRLVDMKECRSHDWIREVMSRAGNALLWITCQRFEASRSGELTIVRVPDFLLSFISEKWTNIQRFDVYDFIHNFLVGPEFGMTRAQYWISLVKQPAPKLREFIFHYQSDLFELEHGEDNPGTSPWRLPTSPFDSTATGLKECEVYLHSLGRYSRHKFTMDMPPSWFSKLRSLTLNYYQIGFHRLLEILDMTRLLEDLEIGGSSTPQQSLNHNIPTVNLPKLSSLRLENWDFDSTVALLDCISPAPGCGLSTKYPNYWPPDHEQLSRDQIVIRKYIQAYFEHRRPTKIVLYPLEKFVQVKHVLDMQNETNLSVWIHRPLAQEILCDSCFSTVLEIELDPTLSRTFSFLESSPKTIFPSLQVVNFGNREVELDASCRRSLHSFLRHRRDAYPLPISVLDLSVLQPGRILCNLDDLEEFTGLIVKWQSRWDAHTRSSTIEQYICGSGRQFVLRFREDSLLDGERCDTLGWMRPRVAFDNSYSNVGWAGRI